MASNDDMTLTVHEGNRVITWQRLEATLDFSQLSSAELKSRVL